MDSRNIFVNHIGFANSITRVLAVNHLALAIMNMTCQSTYPVSALSRSTHIIPQKSIKSLTPIPNHYDHSNHNIDCCFFRVSKKIVKVIKVIKVVNHYYSQIQIKPKRRPNAMRDLYHHLHLEEKKKEQSV